MPESFHFLRPEWLLALVPLPLLIWALMRRDADASAWRGVIQPHLLPHLLSEGGRRSRLPLILLAAGWVGAVLALANPAWERQPTPLLKSRDARVIVLDLSRSMSTPDLPPSRLARARFKIADLLQRSQDGQTGLVVFAGDAFAVSPITDDTATIASLLGALEPGIMPVQGSRADLGLFKAGELMTQAGLSRGEVLLIADEADGRALAAAEKLSAQGYRVSALAVGTEAGAPLPDGRGGFVTGSNGKPVVAALDQEPLRRLADAGGGRYALISAGDQDLNQLIPPLTGRLNAQTEKADIAGERWNERGPWLVLLLVPLAALAFRRGWLVAVAILTVGSLGTPEQARAFGWDDLWSRTDQQAAVALKAGDHARAAELARDPLQRGTALYRGGDLEQALESFSQGQSADAHYNRGNALAKLGKYEEAIAAYDEALAEQPDMDDATYNKSQVEDLLKKRKEQKQTQAQDSQNQPGQQGQESQSGNPSQQSGQQGQQAESKQGGGQPQRSPSNQANAGGEKGDQKDGRAPKETDAQQAASGAEPQTAENPSADASQEGDESNAGEAQTSNAKENGGKDQAAQQKAEGKPQEADANREGQTTDAGEQAADQGQGHALTEPRPMDTEEQQAIDQWLRRIPDDPGGLLRRKFLYQYRERAAMAKPSAEKSW